MRVTLKVPAEEAIDPGLPIIDTHHHIWDKPDWHYFLPQFQADLATGHNIVATVYMEGGGSLHKTHRDGGTMYRPDGPEEFRSLGETEFANGVAAMAASGFYGNTLVGAGIVAFVELRKGRAIREALEAHAAFPRFRGLRYHTAWHKDPGVKNPDLATWEGIMADPALREGLTVVDEMGLTFETAILHPQMPEFTDLARAFPGLSIILDHIGTPLSIGPYAGKPDAAFDEWRRSMADLARCPNVTVKFGGIAKPRSLLPEKIDSASLAKHWERYFETTMELFGPARCMVESNFPVDGQFVPYGSLMNAYKILAGGLTRQEKLDLFFGTANRVYRLGLEA